MKSVVNPTLVKKVQAYKMPPEAFDLLGEHKPLILLGTTGAGKNTIAQFIEDNSELRRMVTTTTRQPRAGEVNGKDYWFVVDEQMEKLIDDLEMIEVNNFPKGSDTIYGTSLQAFKAIIQGGYQPLLTIDIHGTEKFIKRVEDLRPFFILPPSFNEWIKRLEKRGPMTHMEKNRRFHSAIDELETSLKHQKILFVVNHEIAQVGKEILTGRSDAATQHNNRELAKNLIEEIQAHHF